MTPFSLKRLLRKKDIQAVLGQLMEAIAHPFYIQDIDGRIWIGAGTDAGLYRHAIELEGQILEWVVGHADSGAIATLLSMMAQRELDQRHLAQETLDRYKEISLLYDISEKITAQLDLQAVAALVLEQAQTLIQSDRGAVILHPSEMESVGARSTPTEIRQLDAALSGTVSNVGADPSPLCCSTGLELSRGTAALKGFEAIAHFGFSSNDDLSAAEGAPSGADRCESQPLALAIAPGEGILGTVFSNGTGEIVNRVSGDPRCHPVEQDFQALVCAPLKTQARVLGVIVLGSRQPVSYAAGDLKLLSALASQAAAAIENALLHEHELREARIKSNLERYVPAPIVQAILESRGDISLSPTRKNITILFSDIRNFTAHCERLEPELIVGYLNEYFSYMVDIIFAHKGTVNKFVGDMIVALFGAPSAMNASEQQAIKTAIAMQQCIQSFPLSWIRENFHTGIGISSGRVIVGNIGSPQHTDYTAIGDEVNTASRLQSIAEGGQILVSRNVYEATRHLFSFKNIGTLNLKGKRKAIEVFEVEY